MILLEHYQELIFMRILSVICAFMFQIVAATWLSLFYDHIHCILPILFLCFPTKRLIKALKCLSLRMAVLWGWVSVIGFSHCLRLEFNYLWTTQTLGIE